MPLAVGSWTNPVRWDCISIDGKPVEQKTFRNVEKHFEKINASRQIGASPFEILTATAFTIFNDANVKIGVVEVGMGGRFDCTNILNNQAVSVISKIARDHEGFLGNTLTEIAGHKAGILRPSVPYIVNSANEENVINVIKDYATEIGAGPRLSTRTFNLEEKLFEISKWHRITNTLAPFQQENMKMAVVAVMQTLESIGQSTKPVDLAKTLLANMKIHNPGRQEFVQVPPIFTNPSEKKNRVLVDGAHNPDAAEALAVFVRDNLRFGQTPSRCRPESGWPVTWVLAMTEGKDARQYLATLLKPGDKVVTTTFGPVDGMPWVKPMDPKDLLEVAKSVEPQITGLHVPVTDPLRAVSAAKYMSHLLADWAPIVLTGSLYLVGDFHRELRSRSSKTWWTDTDEATTIDREAILKMQAEERERVHAILSPRARILSETGAASESRTLEAEEQRRVQDEINSLNRELQGLEMEEKHLLEEHLATSNSPGTTHDEQNLSAVERSLLEERRFAELHSTPGEIAVQIAKAEKAEADLFRHAERLQVAAKARAEKAEKRQQQKERLEQRRERRAEQKRLAKEREKTHNVQRELKELKIQGRVKLSQQHDHPYQKSRSFPQEERWERAKESNEESQDALSVPSRADQRDLFFSNSGSSASSFSPSADRVPSDAEVPNDFLQSSSTSRHGRDNGLSSQAPGDHSGSRDGQSQSKPFSAPRIHMHYANVSAPNRSKMKIFPLERRTRAWHNPRGGSHPGYKSPTKSSVVNYYEHEYGRWRGSRDK